MSNPAKGISGFSFLTSAVQGAGSSIFQQLREAGSDFAAARSRLDHIRSDLRRGYTQSAEPALREMLGQIEQDPAGAASSDQRGSLLAEAKALLGAILDRRGLSGEARSLFEQAVELFKRTSPSADRSGEFYCDYGLALASLGQNRLALEMLERASKEGSTDPRLKKHLGLLYKETGDWERAKTLLTEASQSDPDDVEVRTHLAQTLEHLGRTAEAANAYRDAGYRIADRGDIEQARAMLQRSLQLAPDDTEVRYGSGRLACLLGADDEAITDFDQVLKERPDHVPTWTCKAAAYLRLQRPADALVAAGHALALAPTDVDATVLQSQALEQSGDSEGAERCLEPALEAAPSNTVLLERMCSLLYARDRLENALPFLDRALQGAPEESSLVYLKGRVFHLLQRNEEARAVLEEGIARGLGVLPIFFELASVLFELDRKPEALETIDRALAFDPANAECLELKTRLLAATGQWEAALETIEQALNRADSINGWLLKATCLYNCERFDEALEAVNRVIDREPDFTPALRLKALILVEQGHFIDALPFWEAVLKEEPNDVEALFQKGVMLARMSPEEAVPLLERVATLAPEVGEGHFQLAEAYRRIRRFDDALREIDRALELGYSNPTVRGTKGQILVAQEKPQEGARLLEQALEADPDLAWAWADLGYALTRLGDSERARSALERALRLNPEDSGSESLLAWVLTDLKRPREAVQVLHRLTERESNSGQYFAQLGEALRRCKEWAQAGEAFDRAMQVSPNDEFVLMYRCQYLSDIGEFEEAARSARAATEIDTNDGIWDAWEYHLLGWALQNVGETHAAEALAAYQQAFDLDNSDIWSLKGIANAQRMLGKKDEARETYDRVLSLARGGKGSANAADPSLLGWCHYALGQYDEAIRLYSSALSVAAPSEGVQFDLALALLCTGRHNIALATYQKGEQDLASIHDLRRRGLYRVAFFDLVKALRDPDVPKANSAIPEVSQCFSLLENALKAAGKTLGIVLPEPKPAGAEANALTPRAPPVS
jgi:tetratricopeptide (TPR) repeat protein